MPTTNDNVNLKIIRGVLSAGSFSFINLTPGNYRLVFNNIVLSGAGQLGLTVSTNNGTSYLATGYNGLFYGIAGGGFSSSTTSIALTYETSPSSIPASGWCDITDIGGTSQISAFGQAFTYFGGSLNGGFSAGYITASGVNAINFNGNAGGSTTITSGTVSLYSYP
jgi:hypothetical protein